MAYVCELDTGYRVYLDNQGTQTIVTTCSSLPGQQQQASNSMATGVWTAPPEAYRSGGGAVFKISTAQGEHFIYIQGSSVSVMGESPSLGGAQQMQVQQTSTVPTQVMQPMQPMQAVNMGAMQPMQPMQPMKMGDMKMTTSPMAMRMGNMEMSMGSSASDASGQSETGRSATGKAGTRQFCSQCGAKVAPSDRFCSSCGNALES